MMLAKDKYCWYYRASCNPIVACPFLGVVLEHYCLLVIWHSYQSHNWLPHHKIFKNNKLWMYYINYCSSSWPEPFFVVFFFFFTWPWLKLINNDNVRVSLICDKWKMNCENILLWHVSEIQLLGTIWTI